jgi:murein DD-endopeptidase MepM/ murein hydrolase activator NlpD
MARVGTMLDQGETLGLLGSTGHSTGPHVHYEVRMPAGRHLDPSKLLFPGRSVSRGYAWNTPRPESTRLAARSGQPRPR